MARNKELREMKHLHKLLPLSFRVFRLNRQNWLIWLVVLIAAAAAACVQPPYWRKGRSFKTWGANRPQLTQAVMFQNLRKGQGNSIPFTIAMLLICAILCQFSFLVVFHHLPLSSACGENLLLLLLLPVTKYVQTCAKIIWLMILVSWMFSSSFFFQSCDVALFGIIWRKI